MKRQTWRKHHKWFGLCFCFFMLMFCLSGIVMNHRWLVSGLDVSRKWLPSSYRYENWNGGLMRGTIAWREADAASKVLIYGSSGVWLTDPQASSITDFNAGLPEGADHRNIRRLVQMDNGDLFAAGIFGLYRYEGGWKRMDLPLAMGERLTDLAMKGDTLVVASRSFLYVSTAPYDTFEKIQLKAPYGYAGEVTLFRAVWLLHSGELFGTIGKLVVDLIALIFIFLCLTGVLYWLMPKCVRQLRKRGKDATPCARLTTFSFTWHNKIGKLTIVFTLFICLTGWCLRPPMMIPLVLNKVKAIPGTILNSTNAWHDKLRMISYDEAFGDWILSTSVGFYSMKSWEDVPVPLYHTPPVSVMGLNVLQKDNRGRWLCGSFSGLFIWDRANEVSMDYVTYEMASAGTSSPFGQISVSGFSDDFNAGACVVEYDRGTNLIPQPAELSTLPMSLWNVALEVHTGRIYIGSLATLFFVFLAGMIAIWCLWSGWKLRR